MLFFMKTIKNLPIMRPVKFCFLGVRKYIRDNISLYMESKIRYMLRKSFRQKHEKQLNKVQGFVQEINNKKKEERIKVVFMCQVPSIWNTNMSIFKAANKNTQIESYILAIPEKLLKENYDVEHEEYGENKSYEYCCNFCDNVINAYNPNNQQWFDLRKFEPDYVFMQRPYDIHLPPQYRSGMLAAYTKICYVSYTYGLMNFTGRSGYNLDFCDNVYSIFAENKKYCDELRAIYFGIFKSRWKKINFLGYPRFDLYKGMKKERSEYKKVILWMPRWTTSHLAEATTFFKYKDVLIDYFEKRPDIRLICRPHPLMFANFISTGEMTESEVEEFKNIFANTRNFYLDESPDYIKTMKETDIYISDTSSMLVEEFITSSPVIFCGIKKRFDKENMRWAKLMYSVSNKKELLNMVDKLLKGDDPLKGERKRYIKEYMKADGLTGEKIVRFLIDDYQTNLKS